MANSIGWGQGVINNTINWAKGAVNNNISWGLRQSNSHSGETNILGTNISEPPTVYNFEILNCVSDSASVYSLSESFIPGIMVYTNPELTIPFTSIFTWNVTSEGMMYNVLNGLVLNTGGFCD